VVRGHAVETLPAGLVTPSLTSQNISDSARVAEVLRSALREIGDSPTRVALVVPDVIARVSLVRFEQVPARAEDLEQLVRWQLRKAAPFPIDEACVTHAPGRQGADGTEFIVALARREAIQEYERVCTDVGAHAGVVDLATLSVLNLFLGQGGVPDSDWLVVHMRPDYTSLVIMRGPHVIFFRSRQDADGDALSDLVHQTAMYYQDRLDGQGFARVFLGGSGRHPGAVDLARRSLEERLRVQVDAVDPLRVAPLADRIRPTAADRDVLAPLVGMLLRSRTRAEAA
jgi:Tfp pilus assembly PilM family ATPase